MVVFLSELGSLNEPVLSYVQCKRLTHVGCEVRGEISQKILVHAPVKRAPPLFASLCLRMAQKVA